MMNKIKFFYNKKLLRIYSTFIDFLYLRIDFLTLEYLFHYMVNKINFLKTN